VSTRWRAQFGNGSGTARTAARARADSSASASSTGPTSSRGGPDLLVLRRNRAQRSPLRRKGAYSGPPATPPHTRLPLTPGMCLPPSVYGSDITDRGLRAGEARTREGGVRSSDASRARSYGCRAHHSLTTRHASLLGITVSAWTACCYRAATAPGRQTIQHEVQPTASPVPRGLGGRHCRLLRGVRELERELQADRPTPLREVTRGSREGIDPRRGATAKETRS
jgi:hypothetical protein